MNSVTKTRKPSSSVVLYWALLAGSVGLSVAGLNAAADVSCAAEKKTKNLYFGDLHIHTSYSMDAYTNETRATPWDAYAFARGAAVGLGPFDGNGNPTRSTQLEPGRELDFAAVTDHSEYLGEVLICTDPRIAPDAYHDPACVSYRETGTLKQFDEDSPDRLAAICGQDGSQCAQAAALRWQDTIAAAEANNLPCAFTTFVGYEWTATDRRANLHRNVIFRNNAVPPLPFSAFDTTDPRDLWNALDATCPPGSTCEAVVIPHNTNFSNGKSLKIEYGGAASIDEQRAIALQRQRLETLLEITQHKGTSECLPGFSEDEACNFELFWTDLPVCGEATMTARSTVDWPGNVAGKVHVCDEVAMAASTTERCAAEIDTFRGALKAGLAEQKRIGVNPLQLGAMASTDTHNGTAGEVEEDSYIGHGGAKDATPELRLNGRTRNSPGGLIAVWAEQNTRDSIFDAMKRRETYATSGPRMLVRFFGGGGYEASDCATQSLVVTGYRKGTPMGGEIRGDKPRLRFLVQVLPDRTPIDRIQVIKGYLDDTGTPREQILENPDLRHIITGQPPVKCGDPGVDCAPLCGVINDPEFRANQAAFYYLRVLEHPTPRWSSYDCAFSEDMAAMPVCRSGSLPALIQERAWTSPIWYSPGGS